MHSMRIEGAQMVNGLMRAQVVRKEEGVVTRFVAAEVFDRDTGAIMLQCSNETERKPITESEYSILSAIMRALTSDYIFKESKVEEDQEQKEKENEPERVRKD